MMPNRQITITACFILLITGVYGQTGQLIKLIPAKAKVEALPGQVVNLAFFAKNKTNQAQQATSVIKTSAGWKMVPSSQSIYLKPGEKKLVLFAMQLPSTTPVGEYMASAVAFQADKGTVLDSLPIGLIVGEVQKIEMYLVKSPDYVHAGEDFRSELLIQNLGNTTKKIFLETQNCQIEGPSEVEIAPGQSLPVFARHSTSDELTQSIKTYFTVRALVAGEMKKSLFRPYLIFPVKEKKKDLYFRFPVKFSAAYLTSNQNGSYQHAAQFELSGTGSLDKKGNHRLDFLARGPNNSNLSFLGMYDQYYISYSHPNLFLFAGEKAFSLTPLTESSRFGMGAESRLLFNNGIKFGFLYLKPRFYKQINHELATFAGFEFNDKNSMEVFYVSKQLAAVPDLVHLMSLNSRLQPFPKTAVELEISRGSFQNTADNALRAIISSRFSIFNLNGTYYYTGKNYPGYFSNSTFYSGNLSLNLTPKLSLGVYAKEDFRNARLDTFFVTAPYSKSFQTTINYNIASRAYLKFYWRQYEGKDRLSLEKFHYKTNSANAQFNHQFNHFEYNMLAEYGQTTNFLLKTHKNQQALYRGSLNLAYRFRTRHAIRFFGSWSNIHRFISGDQQNIMAGISLVSQVHKYIHAGFHLQNAYHIEDYYRNRNLMQLNIDVTPGNRHKFSFRSFYTLFRKQTANPELTFSLNYTCSLGIPLKKEVKAGDLKGRITRDNGAPAKGIMLSFFNKTTFSDNDGRFHFQSVPVGRHLLLVDRSGLAIDELPEIANHFEVEILENQTAAVNFKITRGAKFSGHFTVQKSQNALLSDAPARLSNIILELNNQKEQFRITTNETGGFSFPLVRPGDWSLRIYSSSLPEGYEVEEQLTPIHLEPGQDKHFSIALTPKERHIIFKSDNKPLQPLKHLNLKKTTHSSGTKMNSDKGKPVSSIFYSVQVGAFKRKLSNNSSYFQKAPYDFEKQIGALNKYFIGRFSTFDEAVTKQKWLNTIYNDPFVVKFENGQPIQIKTKIKHLKP